MGIGGGVGGGGGCDKRVLPACGVAAAAASSRGLGRVQVALFYIVLYAVLDLLVLDALHSSVGLCCGHWLAARLIGTG